MNHNKNKPFFVSCINRFIEIVNYIMSSLHVRNNKDLIQVFFYNNKKKKKCVGKLRNILLGKVDSITKVNCTHKPGQTASAGQTGEKNVSK